MDVTGGDMSGGKWNSSSVPVLVPVREMPAMAKSGPQCSPRSPAEGRGCYTLRRARAH